MTINKAHDQTLRVAGIDLTMQCFSQGQLFVALSHVTSKQNMFVFTRNQAEVIIASNGKKPTTYCANYTLE